MKEPILKVEDYQRWALWHKICLAHSKTISFIRHLNQAKKHIETMFHQCPNAYIAWSAGKDSTAMAHLIRVECNLPISAMSIKDDCDFPGERGYVELLAELWDLKVDILTPPSLQCLLRNMDIVVGDDLHGRTAILSDVCFYSLIEDYKRQKGKPGVFLGLRKYESVARLRNRTKRGPLYTKVDGETVCQPICDWTDMDVYGYLFSMDIDPFAVYRCCRLHESPGEIRKSWWLPGTSARYGQVIWLRTYYPSLYRKLLDLVSDMSQYA